MKDKAEVEQFISYFPGENEEEKCRNFIQLFGLEKAGYWNSNNKKWDNVGSVGFAKLSRVNEDDNVYEVRWCNDLAFMNRYNQEFPSPFVACEDCSA